MLEGPLLDHLEDSGRAGYAKQVGRLKNAGYEIERVTLFEGLKLMDDLHRALMSFEMAREHQFWFAEHEDSYRPGTAELVRSGRQVDPAVAARARASQSRTREMLGELLDLHGIDLWLSPAATGPAPEGISWTGNPVMNLPWTHAGLPTLSLPAGRAPNGLPLGLQVSSRYGSDEMLLAWAEGLAEALEGDRP